MTISIRTPFQLRIRPSSITFTAPVAAKAAPLIATLSTGNLATPDGSTGSPTDTGGSGGSGGGYGGTTSGTTYIPSGQGGRWILD